MTITDRSQDASALVTDDGAMGPRSDNPRRRTFTAAYKLSTLTEYDNQPDGASRSALLRREGLYSSHIAEWRRAREAGALSRLSRPAPSNKKSRDEVENDRLRREVSRLSTELAKKDAALEIVGGVKLWVHQQQPVVQPISRPGWPSRGSVVVVR